MNQRKNLPFHFTELRLSLFPLSLRISIPVEIVKYDYFIFA
jgi:hypothetical protein